NYSNNLNLTQTFTSYNGERISANFGSMNMSLGDYIIVYDGPTTAYPVIGVYDASPGIITSTGTSLTFFCYSTSSSTSTGWDAAITCAGPILPVYNMSSGTVTACSGVFYDNGGPAANYTNNQNVTQTFCSGTTDHIQFSFRPSLQATNLDLGDTLFIYDGATASAPPLAILVDGSIFETFTSSGTCLTFRFKSNASGNSLGWAGQFQCVPTIPTPVIFNMSAGVRYVCNAVFYDNGGANNNYSNNLNLTQTFTSYNGERISANFGSMNMSLGDYIIVYDGPTTAYPVIGVYDASPGIITSTGTSLTFFCYSTSSSTSTGWDAAITCAGPILQVYNMSSGTVTACNGVFYDNGGAIGNYPNNENRVMTFTSSTGQYLKFDFNPNHFNMATGDSLFIYDGTSTSAPLYAVFTGSVSPGSITSNTSSFTFRFKSDAATNNVGWQAVFSCVAAPDLNPQISMMSGIRYTCGGNFYDIGGASANYWNNENRTMSFYSNSGCGIRFTFTSFSLSGGDILYVYDGPSITSPLIATLTGSTLPAALQSSGNVLTFRFTSTSSSNSIGWAATISCPNQPLATITANGPLNFCPGDSVILTAAPNATYLWNTGATTQSITVNTAGSYSVNVVNANSCSATSNIVTVTTNASITASATASGSTTFCQGGSVTLNASGGTSYVWSNNSTGSSLQATQSGSYYVIASSGTCVDTSSVINVTVNPLPAVTLTLPQDSFCTNQSPSGLSGGSPTGGSWSGSGVSGNLFNPATAGPGIHIISYTYTDSLGCANIATQTVEVDVCTDITEIQPQHIGIYPNPAQDFVIITISNSSDIKTINVYDLSGRILISEAVNNRNQVQLSLSGISTGVYVISAGNHSVKLVKE
ncbi:MAG: CUB domain-containing protein, partial [Bacteroidota bacterium]